MKLHELIEKLQTIEKEQNASDFPVIFHENTMEIKAYRDYKLSPEVVYASPISETTYDDFDGTKFSYDAYKISYETKKDDSIQAVLI